MAKDDERPQFNPKHRIAGAIILVSLAVIFLPMLLDESAPPKETRSLTEIPARDAPQSDTKVVVTPVPAPDSAKTQAAADPVAEKPASEASAATSPKTETVKTETAKSEARKSEAKAGVVAAVDKKNDASAKPKPVAAKSGTEVTEKISKGWIVQVGTFSNAENADRLRDKLKGDGFAVNAESISVNGGKAVRLRVGPFRDKSAANKAQTQLQKDLNIQGIVLAYP